MVSTSFGTLIRKRPYGFRVVPLYQEHFQDRLKALARQLA
jgi:hypothetical protein